MSQRKFTISGRAMVEVEIVIHLSASNPTTAENRARRMFTEDPAPHVVAHSIKASTANRWTPWVEEVPT